MLYLGKHALSPASRSGPAPDEVDWPAVMARLAGETRHAGLQAYYQAGIPAATTPISDVPLLAMDFETTGLNVQRDDIVSIGLIPMTLSRIRLADSQHWILNPRADLRTESVVIHGITHATIASAPDLNAVLIKLLTMMAGRVMVVHHKRIEQQFLDRALKRRIGEGIRFPCIDTLALEAHLTRQQHGGRWQRFWSRRPSLRLPESRLRYNLPHYPAHNALSDALGCGELLQAQLAHHFSAAQPVGELWRY